MPASVSRAPFPGGFEDVASVSVIGMGYVGLPTALGLYSGGMHVVGIDRSAHRVRAVRSSDVDLPSADRCRLRESLRGEGFRLTTDVSAAAGTDAVVVCVPTPLDRRLLPDLAALQEACAQLVRYAVPGQTLILTSTSFVGTTRQLLAGPLTGRGFTIGRDVFVACSPERIDPGHAAHDQSRTPRVLGGMTRACTARAERVLKALASVVHDVGSPETAELSKLYENTFRAVNIALANEFADICTALGLDPAGVSDAAATKPFGFMQFHPGPGAGGHCIPCDPHYLLWQMRALHRIPPLVSQAMAAIVARPGQVVEQVLARVSGAGRSLYGSRVLLAGVAYKPGVRDVRHSPAVDIIGQLVGHGATVSYYDPLVRELVLPDGTRVDRVVRPRGADWDLALVHTVHPGHDYGWVRECAMVVDPTHRFGRDPRC